jgi:hypothetical protein
MSGRASKESLLRQDSVAESLPNSLETERDRQRLNSHAEGRSSTYSRFSARWQTVNMNRTLITTSATLILIFGAILGGAPHASQLDAAALFVKADDLYAGANRACRLQGLSSLTCEQKAKGYLNRIDAEFISSASCSGLSISSGRLPNATPAVVERFLASGWTLNPDYDVDDRPHGWFLMDRIRAPAWISGEDTIPDMVRKVCSIMKETGRTAVISLQFGM